MAEGGGFVVALYKFNKYNNSTKTPPEGYPYIQGWGFTKDPINIISPRVRFDYGTLTDNTEYNYARIPEFQDRYYFIRNWVWDSGFWWIELEVDPFASFRHEIWNSEQYILRSAYAYNGQIMDLYYPATGAVSSVVSAIVPQIQNNYSSGRYIVGVIGGASGQVGAVTYYAMTIEILHNLIDTLTEDNPTWLDMPEEIITTVQGVTGGADTDYESRETVYPEMLRAQINPLQYIVSCIWVPFNSVPQDGTARVKCGYWQLPVTAPVLGSTAIVITDSFTVPKHPQSARGNYLNFAPFSKYMLHLGLFGSYPLDTSNLSGVTNCDFIMQVDPVSGEGIVTIQPAGWGSGDPVLLQVSGQVGVPIQMSQISRDYFGTAVSAISGTLGNVAKAISGDFGGAIVGGLSAIGDAAMSGLPQLATRGSNGSLAGTFLRFELDAWFYSVVDDDNDHRGRPLCTKGVLKNYPGYLMCADADVDFQCTFAEKEMIVRALNTGMYIEYDVFPEN